MKSVIEVTPLPAYVENDNPSILALNFTECQSKFDAQFENRPDKQFDFSNARIKSRKQKALDKLLVSNQLAWDIYEVISDMMYRGYSYPHRDISNPEHQKLVNLFAFDPKNAEEYLTSIMLDKGVGASFLGESGIGKTTAVNNVLKVIPQVHVHDASVTPYNAEFIQVNWIKIKADGLSMKQILIKLIRNIDFLTGDKVAREIVTRTTISECINKLALHTLKYNVGIIVLDECEKMVTHTKNGTSTKNLTQKAEFLQQLVNSVPIPFILVATPDLEPFLSQTSYMYRRFIEERIAFNGRYEVSDNFWRELAQVHFGKFLLPNSGALSDASLNRIHAMTFGNTKALEILVSRAFDCLRKDKSIVKHNTLISAAYKRCEEELSVYGSTLGVNKAPETKKSYTAATGQPSGGAYDEEHEKNTVDQKRQDKLTELSDSVAKDSLNALMDLI